VSDDPSMLIDGPIPSTLIEEISVTFLPRSSAPSRGPAPLGCPSVVRGERNVGGGLIHEHQARGVHAPQALAESALRLLVSLGGTKRIFCRFS
jgi:hypothetical protein